LMTRKMVSTARASGATNCPRNFSDVPADWTGSGRPMQNWKQKLLLPRPLN
jgi:hypothetical protein